MLKQTGLIRCILLKWFKNIIIQSIHDSKSINIVNYIATNLINLSFSCLLILTKVTLTVKKKIKKPYFTNFSIGILSQNHISSF